MHSWPAGPSLQLGCADLISQSPGCTCSTSNYCGCCSVTKSCPTVCNPMDCSTQASLSITNSHLLKLMSLSQWCYPTISSSVVPFSSCPPSFPASGSFPMSHLFASGGQSIGALVSASMLVMISEWFPLVLISLISLLSKGFLRVFSSATVQSWSVVWHSPFFMIQLSHPCTTPGKAIALNIWTSVVKSDISAFKGTV